jgi:RNA polymerase sigma-32 factor
MKCGRLLPPAGHVSSYFREVCSCPMLSAEAEQALCYRWCDHHDISAARQLVGSHLRLVARVAKVYRGYGLPLEDLIRGPHWHDAGALPLRTRSGCALRQLRAPEGTSFDRKEYILHNWSAAKIGTTASQKKLLTANFASFSSSARRGAVIDTKVSAMPRRAFAARQLFRRQGAP